MNPMPELTPMLKQLRLSGIMDSIEVRNRQAIDNKKSYMDFLAIIVTDEIARRNQKKLAMALRRANFRNQKTLEEFDFAYNPNINRALVMDLASCRFMAEKVGVFIIGPCGTGKSHLAQALGHCAIRAGHSVLFTSAAKTIRGDIEQLPLPGGDHRRMHSEAAGQLSGGFLVLESRQGHLGFELGTVDFSLLSHCQILLG